MVQNYNNYRPSTKDNLTWHSHKTFLRQLEDNGEDILVDNLHTKGLIFTHTNPLNEQKIDRKLNCLESVEIKRGSLIKYNDEDWLVISKPVSNRTYKSCKIYECNALLKWQDETLNVITIPVILADKSSIYSDGVEVSKFFNLANDQILITIPSNSDTIKISDGKRFMFKHDKNIYKVSKVQDLVAEGLIYITMTIDTYSAVTDRVDLGICDYIEPTTPEEPGEIGYSVIIQGDSSITKNYTKIYTSKVFADGIEVFDKSVLFSLNNSNATITNVNGNSCVVKGLVVGSCTLKCELTDDSSVFDEKQIQIVGIF